MGTAPALAEGTASIVSANGAERAAAARPEALEPKAHGEAGRRREMPPKSEAGREVETLPREGKREPDVLPPEGWHKRELLPRKGEREIDAAPQEGSTRAKSGQKRVQISIFGGADFFHTAVLTN